LTGWITAEVGRQPWTVYGQLRTVDAATPALQAPEVATSLAVFGSVYALIFVFGTIYIYQLLKAGPGPVGAAPVGAENPKRPLAVPSAVPSAEPAE
jgi:cytochrome bd ubiquinol oxidase subunit I